MLPAEGSLQTDMPVESCFMLCHDLRSSHISNLSHRMSKLNHTVSKVNGFRSQMPIPCRPFASLRKCRDSEESCHGQLQAENCRPSKGPTSEQVYRGLESFSNFAILDTGASLCIIGDKTLERLKQSLPRQLNEIFRYKDSQVKFRFGNSMYAIRIPSKHHEGRQLFSSGFSQQESSSRSSDQGFDC